jgi:hypothetical protein
MVDESSPDCLWVEANRPVVEQAFADFMSTSEWPKVADLRRHFFRLHQDVDVERAVRDRPKLPGVPTPIHQESLVLWIRHLRFLPQAHQLIWTCIAATRRAVEAYRSTDERPTISSEDQHISLQTCGDKTLLMRAGTLLQQEPGGPVAGSSTTPDSWTLGVNDNTIPAYENVISPEAFVERQDLILRRYSSPLASPAAPMPAERHAFVLMPFRPAWSRPVYEMMRRAAHGLDLVVQRSDDISAPGRITEQIVDAIATADLIVADITDLNPNVMWEMGVAHALGKQVVMLNQRRDDSPFDIRDYRQLEYQEDPTTEDERALGAMLRAALERARPSSLA